MTSARQHGILSASLAGDIRIVYKVINEEVQVLIYVECGGLANRICREKKTRMSGPLILFIKKLNDLKDTNEIFYFNSH